MNRSCDTQIIRELLQYVPKFAGKIFAFELEWGELSDIQKAEVMLDITSLQSLSVKLFLAIALNEKGNFENWAIDFDLKLAKTEPESVEIAEAILNRGQAVLIGKISAEPLCDEFCKMALPLKPAKIIAMMAEAPSVKFEPGMSFSLDEWKRSDFKQESYFERVQKAIDAGVPRVHLLDALSPSVILNELFSSEGVGLMIYRNGYRNIRGIQSEDIPELLTLIGRSVRNSLLVPRVYEEIEERLSDYYVFEIDSNVIGCCALHHYENGWAEVACLYVKQGHGGRGYGMELVKHIEKVAKEAGVKHLFALTVRASEFFNEKLGYKEIEITTIPSARYESLKNSGRESQAFLLNLP